MRKIKALIMCVMGVVLVMSLSSCGQSDEENNPETADQTAEETTATDAPPATPMASAINTRLSRAMESEAIATIGTLNTAARLYYVATGAYPNTVKELITGGYLESDDLNGTYYTSQSGWDNVQFNNDIDKFSPATLTDTKGNTKTFTFDETTSRYTAK
jgi:hypothetical protein